MQNYCVLQDKTIDACFHFLKRVKEPEIVYKSQDSTKEISTKDKNSTKDKISTKEFKIQRIISSQTKRLFQTSRITFPLIKRFFFNNMWQIIITSKKEHNDRCVSGMQGHAVNVFKLKEKIKTQETIFPTKRSQQKKWSYPPTQIRPMKKSIWCYVLRSFNIKDIWKILPPPDDVKI